MWFHHSKNDIVSEMKATLEKLEAGDSETLDMLGSDPSSTLMGLSPAQRQAEAIRVLRDSIAAAQKETIPNGHEYHSRDPLTGLIQSSLGDNVIPELQSTGQGNAVVWIPAGVRGILEHFRAKHPFQKATAASLIKIPNKCKIALFSDWGAANVHATRIGEQVIARNVDFAIHLGDIYFSGTAKECDNFISMWPLRDDAGVNQKASFALNGNHEMYSLGIPYFTKVLPAFGQEASYFTLINDSWQFQGLDTAYEPFSISGGSKDTNLQPQWEWLVNSIKDNPDKKNIFLGHNQPVSAHLKEFISAQDLMKEVRILLEDVGGEAIFAWFFGHEHRCTIYRDDVLGTLFRARLIGNGAIPHHPQEETSSERDEQNVSTTPLLLVNSRCTSDDAAVAVSTFVLLTVDGDTIEVEYIDEDDHIFYKEIWKTSDKLPKPKSN